MKKAYVKPVACKIEFDYTEHVVASGCCCDLEMNSNIYDRTNLIDK